MTQLLSDFLTPAVYFHVSNETQTIGADGASWTVDSTFGFSARSTLLGNFTGTVTAQDRYGRAGGAWLISQET